MLVAKPIDLFYDWLSLFVKLASEAQEVNWSTCIQQLDNQKQLEGALPLTILLVYLTVVNHAMPMTSLNPLHVCGRWSKYLLKLLGTFM